MRRLTQLGGSGSMPPGDDRRTGGAALWPTEERERRATVRLVHYWLSLQRGGAVPAFVDFDPHRNPIAWDQCLLASCGGADDVVLEHVGTALAAVDLEMAAAVPGSRPSFVKEILAPLPDALRGGEPRHASGSCGLAGERCLLYRSVLLPFRSLDSARHYVLGAATFKIEPVAAEETAASTAPLPGEEAAGPPAAEVLVDSSGG